MKNKNSIGLSLVTRHFINSYLVEISFSFQVSHHPAISACHAKGRGWEFWQSASCNIVYWGKSIQAEPTSPVHVNLLK